MAAQERSQIRQHWLVSHKRHLDFLQSGFSPEPRAPDKEFAEAIRGEAKTLG